MLGHQVRHTEQPRRRVLAVELGDGPSGAVLLRHDHHGGGWVLVGRGRDGWTFNPNGQGSPATVRSTVDGTGAFAPAALDTTTITGLLGGADLSANADGIRLRRATDVSGSTRQEIRLMTPARGWTWNLPAGQLMNRIVINGTSFNGSNTKDSAASVTGQATNGLSGVQDVRRIWTFADATKNSRQGFGLGSTVSGSSNASSYLWVAGNEKSPLGFTQVWLRPRIANADAGFSPIPAYGYAAEAKPLDLKNRSEFAPWGVTGVDHTNEKSQNPWTANVLSVEPFGDRMFVGGRFSGVQEGPSGTPIAQGFLAAFDLQGNWISSFRPTFDGRVWAMVVTADGKLIVGGDFTKVNGVDRTGIVALNPMTGEIDPSWNGVVWRTSGERAIVRALETRGDWLWVSGNFNRVSGGTSPATTVTNAANFKVSNAGVGSWKPRIHATAIDLTLSNDGKRMYLGGYFAAVNDDTNMGYWGITDSTTGAVLPGYGPFQASQGSTAKFQLGVGELPSGNIFTGGSEHSLQMYTPDRSQLLNSHITKNGGDFQFAEVHGGFVYAGCHCINWDYTGTNSWSAPKGYRSVDPIRFIARYNAETLEMDTTWYPNGTKGAVDDGPWSIATDKNDCLWMGGDFVRGAYSGNAATDYLGGFARFCGTDKTPPSAPTHLTGTTDPGGVTLTWDAATDDSGSVSYDVYRNDRVVATVFGTSYTDTLDTGATGALRYTVRASDARGNRSASPAPIAVNGPAPVISAPIAWGSTWRYNDTGADLGSGWTATDLDDATWASGPARLGWGGTQATTVGGTTKPITTYYRQSFDVSDAAAVKMATIGVKASQGAVVYVNGIEVGRSNMPAGPVTSSTVASVWIGGADNERVTTFAVPGALLRNGRNVVAVSVHGWRDKSGVTLFDASVNLTGATTTDTAAPSAPKVTVTGEAGGIRVAWTPSTDDQGVAGYLIKRDDAPVAVVSAGTTDLLDAADPATPHTYVVTAFDNAGNTAASATATLAPKPVDQILLDFGSTWRWRYEEAAPPATWRDAGFDASTWNTGVGDFRFGEPSNGTVISTAPMPRPLTSYYRATVTVEDPAKFRAVSLDLVRNAGAVVYVNGAEVARSNMPSGPVTNATYALAAPPATQRRVPTTIEIPASAFTAGTNTIAVELHLGWKSQPTAGFDLRVTGLAN